MEETMRSSRQTNRTMMWQSVTYLVLIVHIAICSGRSWTRANYKSVRVVVDEQNKAFINFTEDNGLDFINVTTKQNIKIVVKYMAQSKPEFYWTKDSSEYSLEAGEKYTMDDDGKMVSLTVKNTTVYDTGSYTVVATSKEKSVQLSMMVYIRDKPTLTMKSILAKPNETATFVCTAIGYPKPSLRFAFIPCSDEPWTNCSAPIPLRQIKEYGQRLPDSGRYANIIAKEKYTIKVHHAGYVSCLAENSEGRDVVQADLLVKKRGEDDDDSTLVVMEKLENDSMSIPKTWINGNFLFVAVLVVTIIAILICYCKKKKEVRLMKGAVLANFEVGDFEQINPDISLDEQADRLPYKNEYEFPREKLKLGKQLGAGAFGVVMKATAYGITVSEHKTTVAVKMVKKQTDNEVMRALIMELKIMIHLGQHLNVVNLLGAVTKNLAKRELLIIVEYCRFGNLQNYLLKHRAYFIDLINSDTDEIDPSIEEIKSQCSKGGCAYNRSNNKTKVKTSIRGNELSSANSYEPLWRSNYDMDCKDSVTTIDLVCWASQVACGMDYLSTRKVLHGDLAARNILLCDDNVVKICDFGLARSIYKCSNYKKQGQEPLPFKWLALECISDHTFGTYSDVWAYGIMLWELFSLARIPYPGMEANQDLFDILRDGYRMEKPQYANQDIYDIMLNCWKVRPDSRPSFKNLNSRFNAMLPEELRNHYLVLNEPYLAINTERELRGEPDYLVSLEPPEEQAPPAPQNYVSGTVVPLPSISSFSTQLRTFKTNSNSPDSNVNVAPFNNRHLSPVLKHNLNTYSQQSSKRYSKKRFLEQIPKLKSRNRFGLGFNTVSKTAATTSANPTTVHRPKITLPRGLSLNDIAYF